MVDSSQLSPLHTLSKQVPNTGNWILSIFNTVFCTNIEEKNIPPQIQSVIVFFL